MNALACVAYVAAGILVDGGAGMDTRATVLPSADADAAPQTALSASVRPFIHGAVDDDGRAIDVSYAPSLTLLQADQPFLLFHTVTLGARAPMSRRVGARVSGTFAGGDLDPARSVLVLGLSRGSVGLLDGVVTLNGRLDAGVDVAWSRRTRSSLDATLGAIGSAGATPAFDTLIAPGAAFHVEHDVARAFSVLSDARFRAGYLVDRPGAGFVGGETDVGGRVVVGRGTTLDVTGGVFAAQAAVVGTGSALLLPIADVRARALWDVAGPAALAGTAAASLVVTSDPLAALLENRVQGTLGAEARLTRDWGLTTNASVFAPVFTFGPLTPLAAGGGLSGTLGTAYALLPWLALEASLSGTARPSALPTSDAVSYDATVLFGLTSTATLFHRGDRPAGSDRSPGRDVGQAAVGRPPLPEAVAPEAAPSDDADVGVDDGIAPPPDALAPPPVADPLPLVLEPDDGPHLKRKNEKKKKKQDDEAESAPDDSRSLTAPPATADMPPTTTDAAAEERKK